MWVSKTFDCYIYQFLCMHFENSFLCTPRKARIFNPFTAKVAIMRLLGSAPKLHLCDLTE
jgi:hypothetical protein